MLKRHKSWLSYLRTSYAGLSGVYVSTLEICLLWFIFFRIAWGRRSRRRVLTPLHAILVTPGDVICPYCGHGLKVRADERTSYTCGYCGEVVEIGPAWHHGLYCVKPKVPADHSELPVAEDAGPSSATPPWER